MSKYTTGELAKQCNVSVRTVQYYDARGILVPSSFSEGGRRLYSEDDLSRLKIICFLRDLNLPIESIRDLFREEDPKSVISVLLDEQEKMLCLEIGQKQAQVARIKETKSMLKRLSQFSMESIGDIAHIMENKKQLRRLRIAMLTIGFVMDAIEVSALMVWIYTGIWWPFALGLLIVIGLGVNISVKYYGNTAFICPQCHTIFKPGWKESIFARHTPNTRKLTCSCCGHRGFCVETYGKEVKSC